MAQRASVDHRNIQRDVFEDKFNEDSWLPSKFLVEAASKRNPLIIPENEKDVNFIDLAKLDTVDADTFKKLPRVSIADGADKEQWASMLVVGDFDEKVGVNLVSQALGFQKSHGNVELVFIHNPSGPVKTSGFAASLAHAVQKKLPLEDAIAETSPGGTARSSKQYWDAVAPLVASLNLKPGGSYVILNGRVVGPMPETTEFGKDDYDALLAYETRKRIGPTAKASELLGLTEKITTPLEAAKLSCLVSTSTISNVPEGIFEAAPSVRTDIFQRWNSSHTAITKGDINTAIVQIVASVDLASEVAQRWIPILKVLSELSGVHLRLYLNPKDRLEELPVKRFYRYVLESQPSFDGDGSLRQLRAKFNGVPADALLNLGMDVPPSWLVAPKDCVYDLDNIKLSSVSDQSDVEATYELENILIEGHSRDITSGVPPRGAELVLGTEKNPHFADTIIMANLGYFQFKANPGFFNIQLESGRSQEIFNIDSAGTKGYGPHPGDDTTEIALMSFQGTTLFPRLSRKPGQEEEDVLADSINLASDIAAKGTKFANKILSKVGLSSVDTGKILHKGSELWSSMRSSTGLSTDGRSGVQADINIFSVASGHLYERMLNIMMLSVMSHTNHTVKFWFIEQFLSPSFKTFLPTMAAKYGFDYEMVTYKWPHWLRGQKEKQREIWGYKILFLDVLFPLDLDKVIFVDADQIVRTDMYELVTHDLQGAPYGFTPMCDSRTEMEGFRFWKQGYWKNFLRGLPYHISALYVVDLKRFRQIAAGDRLRQQYHQLSADPASLSNLDQDLPNNMQMQLPIHSLPQEWLWCETWCSDESLKDAKTIDLCNNPETKEPKLDRARRQVPEWTVYDDEIAALAKRVKVEALGEDVLEKSTASENEGPMTRVKDEL
jgi:UDP-glucose:glycoprotein glucosyltransferase